jgi:hypothetical protein
MIKKIYAVGEINNVRVGMSRINLSDTVMETDAGKILKKNLPVVVYDTSNPIRRQLVQSRLFGRPSPYTQAVVCTPQRHRTQIRQ